MYNFFIDNYIVVLEYPVIYDLSYISRRYDNIYNDEYGNEVIIN